MLTFGIVAGVSALFLGIIGYAHAKGPKVQPRRYVWSELPVVTRDMTYPWSTQEVDAALARWSAVGWSFTRTPLFSDTPMPQTLVLCGPKAPPGFGDLPSIDADPEADGWCLVRHSGKSADLAIVLVDPSVLPGDPRALILAHEIGHALGYDHVNLTGHLMHAKSTSRGWDMRGLEAPTRS